MFAMSDDVAKAIEKHAEGFSTNYPDLDERAITASAIAATAASFINAANNIVVPHTDLRKGKEQMIGAVDGFVRFVIQGASAKMYGQSFGNNKPDN